jgi:hypothetical protein
MGIVMQNQVRICNTTQNLASLLLRKLPRDGLPGSHGYARLDWDRSAGDAVGAAAGSL